MSTRRSNGKANGQRYFLHTNVPLPGRRYKEEQYPFRQMLQDKSKMFYLLPDDSPACVRSAAYSFSKRHCKSARFTVRRDPEKNDQFGCWRVK